MNVGSSQSITHRHRYTDKRFRHAHDSSLSFHKARTTKNNPTQSDMNP